MLKSLSIKNIAVIDFIQVGFDVGLNVLSGETGAGKSIIIDSINAILGERTSHDLIRHGESKAQVKALFEVEDGQLTNELFDLGYEVENGELLVSRDISDGKNSCRVNGIISTNSILKQIGQNLINIHGQQDSQALLSPSSHIDFLDNFVGSELLEIRDSYTKCYTKLNQIQKEIDELTTDEMHKQQRIDILQFQIKEISDANLKIGEDDELMGQKKIVANAVQIKEALSKVYFGLYGGEATAYDLASDALKTIESIAGLDNELDVCLKELTDISYRISDISKIIRRKSEQLDFEEGSLEAIESRLDVIYRLKRKYGRSVSEILEFLNNCISELEEIEQSDDRIKKLKVEEKETIDGLNTIGNRLTNIRKKAAIHLESLVINELCDLDMKNTRFSVDIKRCEPGLKGADKVEFLISTNPGEPLKPLVKIASGGELARIMLAIKSILAESDKTMTLIFDEIDTGVSGQAAQKIAKKLYDISKKKQVICITHLAQIAAMADSHYYIEKLEIDGKSSTRLAKLDYENRKYEIARIIDGRRASEIAIKHAEDMLSSAKEYKNN